MFHFLVAAFCCDAVFGKRLFFSRTAPFNLFDDRIEGFHVGSASRRSEGGTPKAGPLTNLQWLHVPKCGTSFVATLWNYACGQGEISLDLAVDPYARRGCGQCYDMALMQRYPKELYCTPGVLHPKFQTQHLPTSQILMTQGQQVVGLFRRPSQRLISAFHNGMHASGFDSETWGDLRNSCRNSVSCYVNYPGISGCSSRMLTGRHCAEPPAARHEDFDGGRAMLPAALDALELMSFVGITEEWDESVRLFHRMFGGSSNEGEFRDIHSGRRDDSNDYDEADLHGFVDDVDEQVYAAAVRRFETLRTRYPDDQSSNQDSFASGAAAVSCKAADAECGVVASSVDCGVCQRDRLELGTYSSGSTLSCSPDGRCLVDGSVPSERIFTWTHPSTA